MRWLFHRLHVVGFKGASKIGHNIFNLLNIGLKCGIYNFRCSNKIPPP